MYDGVSKQPSQIMIITSHIYPNEVLLNYFVSDKVNISAENSVILSNYHYRANPVHSIESPEHKRRTSNTYRNEAILIRCATLLATNVPSMREVPTITPF